jgi:hypothetical protein
MTEPLTLEERYVRVVLVVVTGLLALGVAVLYSRSLQAVAEIEMLERIPVLDEEPDPSG